MRVLLVAGGLAMLATSPSIATTHHSSSHGSRSTHHSSPKSKSGSSTHRTKSGHASKSSHGKSTHQDKKPAASKAHAAPGGAITVGSGGTKLFCAGRASPLLVRKATQGSGTTVTVICR